jgi:homeobox-leucine zipper protein
VDVREKELKGIFEQFVQSGYAFGAKRWISNLQRHAERLIFSMGIHTSPSDSLISPEGRRSLTALAKQMAVSFFNDISNSTYHHWTCSTRTRKTKMVVRTNKRRGDPRKPPGINRTVCCSVKHLSHHTRIFEFLKDVQTRPLWDSMSIGSSVQELANFTTGSDPRNQISVLAIGNHNDFLLLQECCTDATGSFVIYAPINYAIFQCMLCGANSEPFPLMPSGFSILPKVSGGILDGTLLTIVFQISVTATSARSAVESATDVVQETLLRIRAAVN